MRKIVCSLVMLLVLAGSSTFAQNKNMEGGKGSGMSGHPRRHRHQGHHHRGHHGKGNHNKNG